MKRPEIHARAQARAIYRRAMAKVIAEFHRASQILERAGVSNPHRVIEDFINAERKPSRGA